VKVFVPQSCEDEPLGINQELGAGRDGVSRTDGPQRNRMTDHPGARPPKSDKQNQHFIPRWWLKAFADARGNIWALRGTRVQISAAGDIMSADWIYTLFDAWWRPSDAIEDGLSKIEGIASRLFRDIELSGPGGDEDWSALLWFIALTACRHPRALVRGNELSKELGVFLKDVRQYPDAQSFAASFDARFGSQPPADMYPILSKLPQETIEGTIMHLLDLQPYDPSLPQTDALLATDQVADAIKLMDCRLLKAPAGSNFVLGDRPLPVRDISHGFTIPLSKGLALEARPHASAAVVRTSAVATLAEVSASNDKQVAMANELVIGPDRNTLAALAPVPRP
jgi:hypothetical protein